MSYFVFNGTSSEELGIKIRSKNIYSLPKYDASLISVPGRDGDLISPNNRLGNVNLSYTCYVPAKTIDELNTKIRNIKKWLYSELGQYHILYDSYDSNFFSKATYISKLDIADQLNKIGTMTITFSCMPYKYSYEGQELVTLNTSSNIFNPYPFESKPYIKLYGSGTCTLKIDNNGSFKIWTFSSVSGYVEIDSEMMNFFKDTVLKNDTVIGDGFPSFGAGLNNITIGGGTTKLEIIPRWRCL